MTLENFAEEEVVTLSPLPCWQGLSPEEIRERIAYLVESIEREHAERRRVEGKGVLGAKQVRRRPLGALDREWHKGLKVGPPLLAAGLALPSLVWWWPGWSAPHAAPSSCSSSLTKPRHW